MKKALCILLIVCFGLSAEAVAASCDEISAASFVCMAAGTHDILSAREMHCRRGMASTTKIMTALLAIESGRLEEVVEIDAAAVAAEGTSMGLKTGDCLTLYELTKGMMLSSGNDAANAVALFLAGSQSAFAALMNRKAALLGMDDSHFVTPSGLDDEAHYSSAFDMALLAEAALADPVFAEIAAMDSAYIRFESGDRRYIPGHNKLLREVEGCVGVKTGFTKKSGRCLVSAATRGGMTVIVVTLSAPNDWNDHKQLYAEAFESLEQCAYRLPEDVSAAVVGGLSDAVPCSVRNLPALGAFHKQTLTVEYCLPHFLYAPVEAGARVGYALILADGHVAARAQVVADAAVRAQSAKKRSWKDAVFRFFNSILNDG